jgi:hypothetical protein
MFGPPGHAYVYLIYGVHYCLNIVTGPEGDGQAVLIRALEPLAGIDVMRANRGNVADRDLTNGPGKLCQALGIDKRLDGHDLCLGRALWLEDAPRPEEPVCISPRVGVRGDDAALSRPWRYFLKDNPFVNTLIGRNIPATCFGAYLRCVIGAHEQGCRSKCEPRFGIELVASDVGECVALGHGTEERTLETAFELRVGERVNHREGN